MSYRLDKKTQRKKFLNIALCVFVLLFLIYFRSGIFRTFSYFSHGVFKPVIVLGNSIGEKFSTAGAFFDSKQALVQENETLKLKLDETLGDMSNYTALEDENNKLKDMLGRMTTPNNFILSAILAKPNQSPYDTLIIDAGTNEGVTAGKTVFAYGNIPIGRVDTVYADSSNVVLYSSPGEKTDAVVVGQDAFMQLVGRGGGNFEMILPRGFSIAPGATVQLPGLNPYVLGTVQTILSDPRDAFQKALLISPVNVMELKFVEVQK